MLRFGGGEGEVVGPPHLRPCVPLHLPGELAAKWGFTPLPHVQGEHFGSVMLVQFALPPASRLLSHHAAGICGISGCQFAGASQALEGLQGQGKGRPAQASVPRFWL